MTTERFAVVIPARDEMSTIARVVREALQLFETVIVVDDGSVDGTGEAAQIAGAQVLRLAVGRGYGAAITEGLSAAVRLGAEHAVLLDGDGAHSPADAVQLADRHRRSNADLTIGSRFLVRGKSEIPSQKQAANGFATRLFNLVTGGNVTDAASGLRAVRCEIIGAIGPLEEGFGAAYGLLARAIQLKLSVAEEAISVRYDARELFATTETELQQFLGFCHSTATGELQTAIYELITELKRQKIINVRFLDTHFVLHKIPSAGVFVFQHQNPWFSAGEIERTIWFKAPQEL